MASARFLTVVSMWCACEGKSIYQIARRCGWTTEETASLFRPEASLTPKMLDDLARELELEIEYLREIAAPATADSTGPPQLK